MLNKSDKESLVKSLAIELGLGGVYAEEICILSKIEKDRLPKFVLEKDLKVIYKAIQDLINKPIEPYIVYKKDEIKDITPFKLNYYKDLKNEKQESYSETLDNYFSKFKILKEQAKFNEKQDKIKEIIKEQKKHIKQLEKSEKENSEKAEALYNNYQEVSTLLKELKEISKTHSWNEIKEKLKGHKKIKEVITKDKSIVIEIWK